VSDLDVLLRELASPGVRREAFGDIGSIIRGRRFVRDDLRDSGIPCIHYGEVYTSYGISATKTLSYLDPDLAAKLRVAHPGDVVIVSAGETVEDIGKAVAWLGEEDVVIHDACYAFRSNLDPKYVSYFLRTDDFHAQVRRYITSSKISAISPQHLAKVRIPVPPIEVQREIVRILDHLTELQTELEAELEAELSARRRQHSHYRDLLLGQAEGFSPQVYLPEVSTNFDGRRRPVKKAARTPGEIPYYGASGVVDHVSDFILDGEFLLVSEDGANLRARSTPIAFSASGKIWVNNHAHVLAFANDVDRRFTEAYLNSVDLSPFISGASQPKLNKANLNKIPIPWPASDQRESIVMRLGKLDSAMNGLSIELIAELKSRRQQYEYYRDRLLTFPEAAA